VKKVRLWELLVERALFDDPRTAKAWIMAGKVIVEGQRVDKAGHFVSNDASIRIKGLTKYVGRGGLKLEGALADFGMDVSGQVALDVGAATGGFTDCLLQHEVAKVYAVDVGYGLLAGKLRADQRVVNMERTNISVLSPDQLQPRPSLATVDLSYLSLRVAIPIVACLLTDYGEMLCLVKPLFEVSDSASRGAATIDDSAVYSTILRELVDSVNRSGLTVTGITYSHITGGKGTREFFLRTSKEQTAPKDLDPEIAAAVACAANLPTHEDA
jgi:23S rRNA (cytidine1920-2'-O)/16S rRNA (cytidine1409-2'-O)-methyltransferase